MLQTLGMGPRVASALLVALTAVLLPSGARAWVRYPPVAPQLPAGAPETAPSEPAPPETITPPEATVPAEIPPPPPPKVPPPVPPPEPSPPFEVAPPPNGPPPPETPVQGWLWTEQAPTVVGLQPADQPVHRPRLSAAVGMGVSYDSVGFRNGNVHEIPGFFTVLGIGDGLLGFDLSAFAGSAGREDRATDSPIDRLAVDAFGVFRPGAWVRPADRSYDMRVLHALGAELGLGFERDGRSAISGTRFLIHLGARVDLPLSPASEPTEVRLRLAVRRGIGLYTPELSSRSLPDAIQVGDSAAELYLALVVVF
jgi:hypothetical protein